MTALKVATMLLLPSLTKSANPHIFNLLISPEHSYCQKPTFILVYVHSAPENHKKRQIIRETWANQLLFSDLRVLFFMGLSKSNKTNYLLKLEHSIYGDLVQEDYSDTYRNLTHKAVAALKWMSRHGCDRKTSYILKTDDDVIVNTFLLERHLRVLTKWQLVTPKTIMCHVYKRMKVIRNKKSKWYLSKKEFKDDRFKNYCSGAAFLLTADLLVPMYKASLNVDFFWIDDYYMTGLLASQVNASFRSFNSLYVFNPRYVRKAFILKKPESLVFGHFSHLSDALNQMIFIWNYIRSKFLIT